MSILQDFGVHHFRDLLTLAKFGKVGLMTVDRHTALQNEAGAYFEVYLDDVRIPSANIIEANDEAGFVRGLKRDACGLAHVDPETGKAAEETRRGVVRFKVRQIVVELEPGQQEIVKVNGYTITVIRDYLH